MITKHKLLVDRDCPMCRAYGRAFVKYRLVDAETISYYQTLTDALSMRIDTERARNEIALYNTETGSTKYGVDAFISILAHDKPALRSFLNLAMVYAFLLYIYKFISYNRKVIYPIDSRIACTCDPDLNVTYRLFYITFVAIFTGLVLNSFTSYIDLAFGLPHNPWRELWMCIGQVVWQGTAIYVISREKTWEYLGNMSTVSLIGGLLLLPILALNYFLGLHHFVLLAAFAAIVLFMLLEHIRRCKLLGVPLKLTASWILFRCVVLTIILLNIAL